MKKKVFTWIIVLVSIGVVGAIGAAFFIGFQLDGQGYDQLMGMTPVTVERGGLERLVFADGTVEPTALRTVFPESSGTIIELVSKENDGVSAEDVVARIETVDAFGNTDEENVITPIAGTVLEIPVALDQTVTPQTPMMQVADLTTLHVVTFVDESDIAVIKEGQRATFEFPALPEVEPINGSVSFVSKFTTQLPTGSSVYKVHLSLDSIPADLLLGMTADVEIVVDERTDVVFVDAVHLFTENGVDYLNVVRPAGDGFDRVKVDVGFEGENNVEITSGVQAGDRIILPLETDLPVQKEGFGFGPQ